MNKATVKDGEEKRAEGGAIKADLVKGESPPMDEKNHVLLGGDSTNPTWEEYLKNFKEEFQPRIKGVKECIEGNGLVGALAGNICNDHYFSFEDGQTLSFTWRAWGDLMQAIVNKQEGYMRYYM